MMQTTVPANTVNPYWIPGRIPPVPTGAALWPPAPGISMPVQFEPLAARTLSTLPVPLSATQAWHSPTSLLNTLPVQNGATIARPVINTGMVTETAAQRPAQVQERPFDYRRPVDLSGRYIQYSDTQALLDTRQVQQVDVLIDPHSFTALPVANITLTNGARYKMILPRETEEFRAMLDDAGVPYAYRRNEKEGIMKTVDSLGATAKELLVPFLLLVASGASAAYAMKKYQQSQADGETAEAIKKSHKDLSGYPFEYKDTLRDQDPQVRKTLNSFLRKELDVVVAKGLPGVGKTHVFLSLAKEVQKRDDGVFVLEIRPGVGDSVRDLLKDMYSGDKVLAEKAIKFLTKENGGRPVKELLLYADEVEKIPGDLMDRLLVNGIQNPDSTVPGLPRLRMLATCNGWPAFINNSATESRVASMLITPPPPKVLARIFADALSARLGGKVDKAALEEAVLPVLREYEGYSPRTITQSVVKKVTNNAQSEEDTETRDSLKNPEAGYEVVEKSALEKVAEQAEKGGNLDPKELARVLEAQLMETPLKNTEMAALIVRLVARSVQNGPMRLDPVNGPDNLWRSLQDDAEKATKSLNQYVNMNGKQAKLTILRHLQKYSLDYVKEPQALNLAVTGVADDLKTERLAALRDPDGFLQSAGELADFTVEFLDRTVEKEKQAAKQEGRSPDPIVAKLETAARNLKHLDLTTDLGKKFMLAAGTYREIRTVEDPTDAAFLDNNKLDAVLRRALNYNPKLHNRDNDFKLIADPVYASLFKYLRDALKAAMQA